jgi:hypothetical protein
LGDVGGEREDNNKMNIKDNVTMWSGFIWLRIRTGGGLL